MNYLLNSLSFLLSFFFTWLLLFYLIPFFQYYLPDNPNSRSSHKRPVPRGGGVVFVFVSSVFSALALVSSPFSASSVLPLLALPLAFVGLLDDRFDLPATFRYGVQLITAFCVVVVSPLSQSLWPQIMTLDFVYIFICTLIILYVTSVINFTNFMDGLDGLVASCMFVAMTSAAITIEAPFPIWSIVGSLLGLLIWNWSPAKVFMGDVGSTFLGAVFAAFVLQASSWPEAFSLLLVATPLLGDALICVPRRMLAGQRVFEAHRLHLFQRLYQAGWSHARVSTFYVAGTVVLAFTLFLGGLFWLIVLASLELLAGVWLDKHVAVPFPVASRT